MRARKTNMGTLMLKTKANIVYLVSVYSLQYQNEKKLSHCHNDVTNVVYMFTTQVYNNHCIVCGETMIQKMLVPILTRQFFCNFQNGEKHCILGTVESGRYSMVLLQCDYLYADNAPHGGLLKRFGSVSYVRSNVIQACHSCLSFTTLAKV